MPNFRISVIMGIYNCASTLIEALDSLYAQTYKDFKIILCEDGSSDNTYQVAADYAEKHDNIILIKNERNMGLNYTLNHCLEYANTEYVARMDGDDISLPDRFEKEIKFLDEHPEYAVVSGPMIYFDETGDWGKGTAIEYPQISDFIHHSPFFCHAPCMIRKDVFISVGGYSEDSRTIRFEDCHLWYKIYAAGYKGFNLTDPLYKMRDDSNAYKRRTLRSRMNASYVKYVGFKMLHMPWYNYFFVLESFMKNLAIGIIPTKLYYKLHRSR